MAIIAALNADQVNVLNITAAIVGKHDMKFVYTDSDGVMSLRHARPTIIKRALNGQTVVQCYDLNRQDYRSFRLARIAEVTPLI